MTVKKETKEYFDVVGKRLSNTSFLNIFPLLSEDNEYFFNIWRVYSLNDSTLNKVLQYNAYEVDNSDWWENISYSHYENVNLWWIVPMVNNVNNPFEELEPGTNLNLFRGEYLYQILKEIKIIARL
jgi:hypothetical protein